MLLQSGYIGTVLRRVGCHGNQTQTHGRSSAPHLAYCFNDLGGQLCRYDCCRTGTPHTAQFQRKQIGEISCAAEWDQCEPLGQMDRIRC